MIQDREHPEPASGERGVFGNLPSERPGVRSPRRGEGTGAKSKSKPATPSKSKPATPSHSKAATERATAPRPAPKASPPPAPARERPAPPPPSEAEPPESGSGRGGVEEVAWAGITVAAEAATLGVRLFSRALEAVRERR
jgi:hypothetical protein